MNRSRKILVLLILLGLVFSQGCVKRNLRIVSVPSDATVYFNGERIGKTPLDYDFVYYAVHKVELEKKGYKRIVTLENLKPPLYLWFPLDLIFELIPYTFWDRKELTYILTPLDK